MNIGPKPDGTFPLAAIRRLREMGAWLVPNGEAVYDTSPVKIEAPKGVYLTQKTVDNRHYLYISLSNPIEELSLPINSKIKSCNILESNMPVNYSTNSSQVKFEIPATLFKDCTIQVLKLEVSEKL